jgi:AAA+ ATPase superfamily predicted ATPase
MVHSTVNPIPFYNRTRELEALDRAWRLPDQRGQLALIYGRRRLGKTYLLQRFFTSGLTGAEAGKPHCYFLAEQTTAQNQRMSLAEQLLAALGVDGVSARDLSVSWAALLRFATDESRQNGRLGLILDEFQYLVDQTPEFWSTLQAWWDRAGAHSGIFLVLCGSQMSSMQSIGSEVAPLFGRFNAGIMKILPMRFDDVAEFYRAGPTYGLAEVLTMYGVLGGVPRYHAMVDTSRPMAEQIVDLILRPFSPLAEEVRFLLGSEQIREPASYSAILQAVAAGATQFGRIMDYTGTERGALSFQLRTLMELGWMVREHPFGETSDRRAIYRIAEPFVLFWYRFAARLASALQFGDPARVYEERVAPYLADYMGRHVFEGIAHQWLQRHSADRLGLSLVDTQRYWSRDGRVEIDIVGTVSDGSALFGECKWRLDRPVGMSVLVDLKAKAAQMQPAVEPSRRRYVLFAPAGFDADVRSAAEDPDGHLWLVGGDDLLAGTTRRLQ